MGNLAHLCELICPTLGTEGRVSLLRSLECSLSLRKYLHKGEPTMLSRWSAPPYVGRASIGAALGLIQRVQSDVFYSRFQTVHLGCARGRENIRVVTLSRSYMNP